MAISGGNQPRVASLSYSACSPSSGICAACTSPLHRTALWCNSILYVCWVAAECERI